jgi:hypothetical protein
MDTVPPTDPLSPSQLLSAASAGQSPDEYRAAQAADPNAPGDDQPVTDPPPEPAPEPEPQPTPEPEPAPYVPPQPDAATERLAAIATERAALLERIDAGEMTFGEYEEARAPLDAEQRTIEISKAIADHEANVRQQQAAQSWSAAQQRFWAEPGNDKLGSSPVLFAAMNAAIGVVANEPGADPTDFNAMLAAAKARVMSEFGAPPAAASKRPTASAAPPPPVYSLTDIPGGQAPATDPFAAISAKTGMDQIRSLDALTDDQLDRWMTRRL